MSFGNFPLSRGGRDMGFAIVEYADRGRFSLHRRDHERSPDSAGPRPRSVSPRPSSDRQFERISGG